MSAINVLFFSNKCEGSKHLLGLMQSEGLDKFFHLICTDSNPKVPKQITRTPTILIKGIPTPYVGSDAFVWFSKIKQWKLNVTMQKVSDAQKNYLNNINSNLNSTQTNGLNNILGFSQLEMNGMSDIFAYLLHDNSMPHNYFDCNNLGKENMFVPGLNNNSQIINKITANKQRELSRNLLKARSKQEQEFKSNIDNFVKQYRG